MNFKYRNEKNALAIAAYWKKPLDVKSEYFTIKNDAESNEDAEILIFDYVGWPYNDPRDLINALNELNGKDITARINSPGGSAIVTGKHFVTGKPVSQSRSFPVTTFPSHDIVAEKVYTKYPIGLDPEFPMSVL